MFYLTVNNLISAVDDLNKNDLEGAADVMKQAIVRAEKLDPDKEALFIIQDDKEMSSSPLYKIDSEGASFKHDVTKGSWSASKRSSSTSRTYNS